MAVNEIAGSSGVATSLSASLQGEARQRVSPRPGNASASSVPAVAPGNIGAEAPAPVAGNALGEPALREGVPPAAELIRENVLLVNEVLRGTGFGAARPTPLPLFSGPSPVLAALLAGRELTPLQQNALLINQTLQALAFVPAEPADPLLIDELPATLEAAGITEDLDITQQNVQLINQTLREIGGENRPVAVDRQPLAAAQVPVGEVTATVTTTAAAVTATIPPPVADAAAAAAVPAASPSTASPAAVPVVAGESIPIAAGFLIQGFSPATLPLTLFPERTPYVHVVYQLPDPAPPPGEPEPIGREVTPAIPVAASRMVGDARLRRLLRQEEGSGMRNREYRVEPVTGGRAERSIRTALTRVNADMASRGSPLHLVFTRHADGFAVDVYDCSYNEACRLAYDVPIPLDNLTGMLGNLQDEAGIIVDTTS
ncbi:MAG: hypothetical protein AB1568_00455 [Thermodesulfobacteriota bacterium]